MVATQAVLSVIRASAPEFRTAQDRVAFAVHASFMAAGYCLAATGSRAGSSDQELREVGIQGWNELDGSYAFKYFTDNKDWAKVVDLRCTVINDLLMVDAASSDSQSDPVHLELKVSDYANEQSASTLSAQYKNLDGLVKIVGNELVEKFSRAPKIDQRPQYRREGTRTPYPASSSSPYYDGSGPGGLFDSVPAAVGRSDLMPGVGAGVFEPRRDAAFESGEGDQIIGPHHPIFSERGGTGGARTDFPDGGVPLHPPGSKFDPFGPPGVPGFEPQRFGRGAGREPHLS